MNTALKDISTNLNDLKLITSTQVDLSYFNSLVGAVFSDPSIYASIQSDVQFINQIGGQLFNYFTASDPNTQKIWYVALKSGLNQSIDDANDLISKIPLENPKGADLTTVLNIFITDCQSIQKIIPLDQNQVAGASPEELN
ncbi:MAG: hypothetical protein EKK61_00525 [Rickettsiales bacterium]|nr:MAG: hypothetical protein EKK61_00525 [Rickettsiales bacterium]